ncbi:MAG: C40 family peptidase [Bacteroidia bacterium]|nr:C40 family peptidase [Bacteroidia bacterium]
MYLMPNLVFMNYGVKYALLLLIVTLLVACKARKETVKTKPNTKESVAVNSKSNLLKKQYAEKLSVSESAITNEALYQFIDDWMGVPYKYAGKDKRGIDCSALTSTLYQQVYQKKISDNTKSLVEETKKITKQELKEGDLVFFITNGKSISHVGVYLHNNKFVHASSKKGVMISDLNEPYFIKTFSRAASVK